MIRYYDYCYDRHISREDQVLLSDVHSLIREELDLALNQKLVQKVPRFQDIGEDCLLALIHIMISKVYLPREVVYLAGERGTLHLRFQY